MLSESIDWKSKALEASERRREIILQQQKAETEKSRQKFITELRKLGINTEPMLRFSGWNYVIDPVINGIEIAYAIKPCDLCGGSCPGGVHARVYKRNIYGNFYRSNPSLADIGDLLREVQTTRKKSKWKFWKNNNYDSSISSNKTCSSEKE